MHGQWLLHRTAQLWRVLKGGTTPVAIRTGAVGQGLFEVGLWGGERLWTEAG